MLQDVLKIKASPSRVKPFLFVQFVYSERRSCAASGRAGCVPGVQLAQRAKIVPGEAGRVPERYNEALT